MDALHALGHRFESDYLHNLIILLMKYLLVKDRRRRILYALYERRRNVLLSLVQNRNLSATLRAQVCRAILYLPRDTTISRLRNRCTLTGRPRAVYRRFGLSRLRFRRLAWQGNLAGVKKAS